MVTGQMDYLSDIWDNPRAMDELIIGQLISAWHESDSEIPLIEFLGVTGGEYAAWVEGYITATELLERRNG